MIKRYKQDNNHTICLNTATRFKTANITDLDATVKYYKNCKVYLLTSDDKLDRINYIGVRDGNVLISTTFEYRECILDCGLGLYGNTVLRDYTLILGEEYGRSALIGNVLAFVHNDFLDADKKEYKGYYI